MKTTTQTVTKVEVDVAIRRAELTNQEEKVLRMLHGIPMAHEAELQTHAGVTAQTRAQLEALEHKAVDALRRQRAVIDRLRKIDR